MYNWFEKQFAKHRRKMQTGEGGFTLVEMLVVIAILGILGGVGTVGYQGYVAHAREKADKEIIAVVNSAFASACLENRIDVPTVTEATVSVLDQTVRGLSTVTATGADIDAIAPAFDRYFAGNEGSTFSTENVNSLVWNVTEGTFEISAAATALRITLSSGKTLIVSAEDVDAITNSTYADMGYTGVKNALNNVRQSGETLAGICSTLGLSGRLTNAFSAFGIIDSSKLDSMNDALDRSELLNPFLSREERNQINAEYNQAIQETANGLSMVTAKYLASGGNVNELIEIELGNSSAGVIRPLATGTGGTKTVSAIAVQYALASGFANSSAAEGITVGNTGLTVSEYLASAEDPVTAINTVKNLDAYKNKYVGTEQYENDKNGFVGTMSLLGDNIGSVNPDGTVREEGNISIDGYLTNGLESSDAKDVLTSVLGE